MDIFQIALLIGAVVVAALNWNQPRALIWIAAAAVNFALTDLYFYHAPVWLPHAFVTGVADATLVIFIATYGKYRWERMVRYAFQLSILVSVAFLLGWIPDQTSYAIGLEVCNWLALLVMGGAGIIRLADERFGGSMVGQGARSFAGRAFHWLRVLLDASRQPTGVLARAVGQGSQEKVI